MDRKPHKRVVKCMEVRKRWSKATSPSEKREPCRILFKPCLPKYAHVKMNRTHIVETASQCRLAAGVVAGFVDNSSLVFLSDTHSAVRYGGLGSEVRVKSWESRLRDRQGVYYSIYYSHGSSHGVNGDSNRQLCENKEAEFV